MKPNQKEESGQIINIEAPIHSSNLMMYSKEKKICSRYKIVFNKDSLQQEFLYKNKHEIPKITKIIVNRGLGEASQNSKILDKTYYYTFKKSYCWI